MKAAIEAALGNVTQTSFDKCLESIGDSQWQSSIKEFRRKRCDRSTFLLYRRKGCGGKGKGAMALPFH